MHLPQRTEFYQQLLSYFFKFCFSLRTFHKESIWCTNNPNAHIRTFSKRWSFIWRSVFPVWPFRGYQTLQGEMFHLFYWIILCVLKIAWPSKNSNSLHSFLLSFEIDIASVLPIGSWLVISFQLFFGFALE